jgi:type I restriction enzyme S subunit
MTEVNTHKEGYKHTPLGWIPENWSVKSLGDDIEYLDAGVSVNSTDAPLTNNASAVLKTSAVSKGILDINQRKAILSEDINRAKLNPRRIQ